MNPVPEPGRVASGLLAVVIHVLFFGLLFFGISWQKQPIDPVFVEYWEETPPEPKPEPSKPEAARESPQRELPKPKPVPTQAAVEPPKPQPKPAPAAAPERMPFAR